MPKNYWKSNPRYNEVPFPFVLTCLHVDLEDEHYLECLKNYRIYEYVICRECYVLHLVYCLNYHTVTEFLSGPLT